MTKPLYADINRSKFSEKSEKLVVKVEIRGLKYTIKSMVTRNSSVFNKVKAK